MNSTAFTGQLVRLIAKLSLGLVILMPQSLMALESDMPSRSLDAIESAALAGDRAQLIFTLSESAPEPEVFTVDKPARLSIDLADTRLSIDKRYQEINVGQIRAVAMAEAQGRTRVVIELTRLTAYDLERNGNQLSITFGGDLADSFSGLQASTPITESNPAPSGPTLPVRNKINLIDFRRGEAGEGRVIVKLDDEHAAVDVRQEGGKIVAEFMNIDIDERLIRRLDVLDFATPVQYIDSQDAGQNTKVIITPNPNEYYEQVAYQSETTFTIELQPLTQAEIKEREETEPTFSGERISLSFQSVDVRSVIQIIADVAEINIVADESVSGEMALRLDNVPWDQALDIIMKAKGLDKYQEGDVIFIDTLDGVSERESAKSKVLSQRERAAPLSLELIQVNYAKAAEIGALLQENQGSGDEGSDSTGFLSSRGSVTVDERTNTLLIHDTQERLEDLRRLISTLDVPIRQVLIESRIVIASDNFSRDLGIRHGLTALKATDNHFISTTGGSSGTDGMTNDFVNGGLPVGLPAQGDRFNVNLPIANPAGRIALAILGSDYLIDLELQAMQAEGDGEILSNPRVVTTDRQEAVIKQGFEVPYQSVSADGTNVQFKEAVLELQVTPQITPDDDIIMDLNVKKDEPDFANAVLGQPPLIKREISTQVLVNNGETVVLGGVFESTRSNGETKVPIVGDLPIVGNLFKTRSREDTKNELLIFVTPKLLTESLQLTTQ